MPVRRVVHLEGQHRSGRDLEGRALRKRQDIRTWRRCPDERTDLPLLLGRSGPGRSLGRTVCGIAHKHRTLRRGAYRTRGERYGRWWSCRTFSPRHAREHQHVVHDFARARQNLERLHPLVFSEVGRNVEVLVCDGSRSRHGVRLGHRHDRVRRADAPARRVDGRLRKHLRVTLWRPSIEPAKQRLFVRVGKPSIVHKRAVRCIGVPRRHVAAADRVVHLVYLLFCAIVLHQREGGEPADAMTARAILEENRRDFAAECRRAGLSAQRCTIAHTDDANDRHERGKRDRTNLVPM